MGPAAEVPARVARVAKVVSPARFFDERMLQLARWVSERYVAPLAAVLGSLAPPRVASEEDGLVGAGGSSAGGSSGASAAGGRNDAWSAAEPAPALGAYRRGGDLLDAIRAGAGGAFVVRPAPEDEQAVAVEAVAACLGAGRRAVVLVPEAAPVPATAVAIADAFGERVAMFLGGDGRARYRRWLEILSGRYDVVVGTRPAAFAPLGNLGLVYVSRESHPAHREDRSPYYHVRDVALARGRIERATVAVAAICPSSEAAALGLPPVEPGGRRWPPVEVVRPVPGAGAPRLARALRTARRAFLFAPVPGGGVARVCRTCGAAAACAACGGVLRLDEGELLCSVCGSAGRCAACGSTAFGIAPGGRERVEAWAKRVAAVPVRRVDRARLPGPAEVLVGGPETVKDLGPAGLDLVGILDADLAERRPGLAGRERALCTWMEAVAWARPAGRAIVQSSNARDPAVQAVVRGRPDRFHADEAERRRAAGFPVGAPVFRVTGDERVAAALERIGPITLLVSSATERTVCLIALEPDRVSAFGRLARDLAADGAIERVEAELHLSTAGTRSAT